MRSNNTPLGPVNKGPNKHAIARVFGLKNTEVTYLKEGVDLLNFKILYDPATQLCFWKGTATGVLSSWSMVSSTLNIISSGGSFALQQAKAGDWISALLKASSGGDLIGLIQGTLQSSIQYVTPKNTGAIGDGTTDDSVALKAADTLAVTLGMRLDGQGLTYAVGSTFRFDCGYVKNINLIPTATYTNAAPTFMVNQTTGQCTHENVNISGFPLTGTKIFPGSFTGVCSMTFLGSNKYNNNGSLQRTTTTTDINTATAYVVSVVDASIFAANDYVQIGDGKYQILSISGNTLTLVNNGTGATLFGGVGSRYLNPLGQYVTKNLGEDNNGIRIGNGTALWNVKCSGSLEAMNNGWSGFFIYTSAHGSFHELRGIKASYNGFIGIGLGYTSKGYITDCVAEFNGNNNIDSFETKQTYTIHDNIVVGSGVDGIFAGGDGELARILNNKVLNNQRIGILVNGRNNAIEGATIENNHVTGNKLRSIGLTGVRYGVISGGAVGGATGVSIYIEGKDGLYNPDKITLSRIDMYPSTGGDGGGNLRNNTTYTAGTVDIINCNTFNRMPVFSFSAVNFYGCKFYPETLISGTESYTATAGTNIAVSVTLRRPHNTTVTDATWAEAITMSISTASDGSAQGTVTSATKNTTNAQEELNLATTQGKIRAIPANGLLSYNFNLSAADLASSGSGVRYLLIKTGGFKKLVTLTWTAPVTA